MLRSSLASPASIASVRAPRLRVLPLAAAALGALVLAACSGSSPTDASRAMSTDSLKVGQCTSDSLGDGKSCLDVGLVKEKAAQACEVRGLSLGDLSVDDATGKCATSAKYACCKTDPTPDPGGTGKGDGTDPGKGGAGGGGTGQACTVTSLGSPDSCADIGTWKDDAVKTCSLQGGASLAQFDVADVCGSNLFRFVKIECCAAVKPPPPPQQCFDGAFGGATDPKEPSGGTCVDAGTLKEEAATQCETKGFTLVKLDLGPACANGGFSGATFSCCGSAQPPPVDPPPPTACVGDALGDGKTCQPDDVLQKEADVACAQQGLTLGDFATSDDCGTGSSHFAKFSCCKAAPLPDPKPVPPPPGK